MTFSRLITAIILLLSPLLSSALRGDQPSYRRGMTMITPAAQWREALPSGNGQIGALVHGSVGDERVIFNHNELWYSGNIDELPDMSGELSVVRRMMREGRYLEANEHYRQTMRDRGFTGRNARYHPAFDLILDNETRHLFEDYSRTLDFESGEIVVKWRDGDTRFSRRLFVSIPDDLVAMSIRSDQAHAVNGRAALDIHDLRDAINQAGVPFDPGFTHASEAEDGFLIFRADGSDGGEFGGVARVIVKNGTTEVANERRGPGGGSITYVRPRMSSRRRVAPGC